MSVKRKTSQSVFSTVELCVWTCKHTCTGAQTSWSNDWKSIFMLKVIHVAEYRNISNVNTSNQTLDVCILLRKIVVEVDSCHKTGQEDIWWKPIHIFANKFPYIYHVSAWMGLLSWGFFLNNSIFLCQNGWDFCLNSKILAKFYQQQKTISDIDRDW